MDSGSALRLSGMTKVPEISGGLGLSDAKSSQLNHYEIGLARQLSICTYTVHLTAALK
jgi:hypothetical protein